MKRIIIFGLFLIFPLQVFAEDITSSSQILINENAASKKITDDNESSYITVKNSDIITITNEEDIDGLYIVYELKSMEGTIESKDKKNTIGENNFLHEYINVFEKIGSTKEVTIQYNEDVKIAEMHILSKGELPEYVEVWNPPLEEADLLLISTHSDDEQLFFLGLLPTYVAKGAYVQVAYFVNHNDNPKRLHEQLHGLYVVGIRNYPIIGSIPDAYSETLEGAINNIEKANITLDDAINFQVELLRRFKPSVVVGHDEKGEYSHGQHILNTHTLKLALEKSNDATYHTESYDKYGVWDVPKTYIHLYKENQIIMDYDTPLDYFDGLTAYEVSKKGYSEHHTQQWTWFTRWINGSNNEYTKSTDIKTYSPNEFGLYRSLVGDDLLKNDMFENLTYRKDIVEDTPQNEDNDTIKEEIKDTINYFEEYKIYIIIGGLGVVILIIIISVYKKNKSF